MPEHAVIFGSTEAGNYSQAGIFGSFSVVLNLIGSTDEINLEFGHTIIRRLEEIINESPELTPSEIVKTIEDEFRGDWKLNIIIAKTEGPKIFIASLGDPLAKLIRQGKIINLVNNQTNIAGPIKVDDVLVLGTPTFFEKLFTPNIFDVREDLSLKLEQVENQEKVSGLVLRIKNIEEPEELIPQTPIKKDFFLRQPERSSLFPVQSKKTLYAVLLAFVFLISIISFQLRSRNLEQRTKNEIKIEKQANDGLASAKNLTGLNDNIARDILNQTKKDLLNRAQESFGTAWQKENNTESNKLKAVLENINNQLALVSHIYTLESLDAFSDFNLLRANANISSASLYKNEIMVIDSANGAVYSLGTKTKTAEIIGGGDDFKKENYIDFAGNKVYAYTSVNIYEINASTNTLKTLIKPSAKWGKIRSLKTFAGNIYLLDADNNQIWKYQGTDLGFADIAPYLKSGVDFSKVSSFAIEGNIYVLSSSGNIALFSGGSAQDFNITGLEKPLNNPSNIFTTDETKNVYILDTGRVVVLDKKGVYQSQYLLPARIATQSVAGGPTNDFKLILADETIKKVFLISGSKVYSFDLR